MLRIYEIEDLAIPSKLFQWLSTSLIISKNLIALKRLRVLR